MFSELAVAKKKKPKRQSFKARLTSNSSVKRTAWNLFLRDYCDQARAVAPAPAGNMVSSASAAWKAALDARLTFYNKARAVLGSVVDNPTQPNNRPDNRDASPTTDPTIRLARQPSPTTDPTIAITALAYFSPTSRR